MSTAALLVASAIVIGACSGAENAADGDATDGENTTTTRLEPTTSDATTADHGSTTTTEGAPSTSSPTGPVSVIDLGAGDCFDAAAPTIDPAEVREVDLVACEEAHDSEVFAQTAFESVDPAYPGEDELIDYATNFCVDEFQAFVGLPYTGSAFTVSHFWPTVTAWENTDDRTILCVLFRKGERLTGSARDTGL